MRLLSPRDSSVSATGSRKRTGRRKTALVLVRLLDRWLGISPWGLIIFLLLGFAAGVLNVMRAAGIVRERNVSD
jgi:hypothetical protein